MPSEVNEMASQVVFFMRCMESNEMSSQSWYEGYDLGGVVAMIGTLGREVRALAGDPMAGAEALFWMT